MAKFSVKNEPSKWQGSFTDKNTNTDVHDWDVVSVGQKDKTGMTICTLSNGKQAFSVDATVLPGWQQAGDVWVNDTKTIKGSFLKGAFVEA